MTEPGVRLIETPGGCVFVSDADQGPVARALRNKGRHETNWTAWVRAHVRVAALGMSPSFHLQ